MRTAAFYLILSLWPLCVSAQSESPAPAGEINSPKPDAVSRRECEGAFTSLPAALRFDTLTSGATEQKLERGVWRYLCARKALTAGDWEGVVAAAQLPPRTPPIVGGSFIRSLLLSNQFDVPGYSQISIEGAIIDGPVDLSHEILRTGLALLDCTFSGLVDMSFARSDHDIDFSNSTFYEGFRGKSMHVSGSLYFGSPVDLVVDNADAPTGNDISAVNGNLESAVVSWLKYLDLAKSSIQGDFRLASAFVEGETNLFDISVAKLLDIQDSSIADVNATVATVGQLEVKNTSIRASSNFQADGISIAHSAYIDRSRFPTTLYLTKATIQSDLSFRGSALTSVDLSEAR